MASRQELESALVKADRAGDEKSARMFAAELKRMSATPEQLQTANPINRLATGVVDAGVGLSQGVANVAASPVGQALKQEPGMSNLPFVGGAVNLLNAVPAGAADVLNTGVNAAEQKYKEAREAVGNKGVDWYRAAGNVAGQGLLGAVMGPSGAVENMAASGATALLTPTRTDQGSGYGAQKAQQAAIGVVASGVLSSLGALARGAKDKFVNILTKEGIRLTPGQASGATLKSIEDRLTSLPLTGDAIKSARAAGLDEFNRAAYKRALDPIGESLGDVPVGREAIASIGNKLNAAYDDVLPLVKFKPDGQFAGDLRSLATQASTLPPEQQSVYRSIMTNYVLPKIRTATDGKAMKEAEEVLGKQAADYGAGTMPADRQLASLFRDVRSVIRENLMRSNPQLADRIKAIDEGWKAYDVITQAGLGSRAAEGFTPNALSQAVKAANRSYRKRAVSHGEAFMQDLSDAAQMRLPSVYPDSGTAGRTMLAEGAGLVTSPLAIPYLPGVRNVTSTLATQRLGMVPGVPFIAGAGRAAAPVAGGAAPTLRDLLYGEQ